ncbi:group 3 secretory phospholipase A2 isoform 3-T3 [Cyanocitta cristata]
MRARLARRSCVCAGGGGGGRRVVRGIPECRHRARAGRERLGRPRPPPRLLGSPRSAPRPRLPRRLRAPPARRARGRAAPGPVRPVAAPRRLHRPRDAGTATPPPPGLDAARHAVVRRGGLRGELERAGAVPRPRPVLSGARPVLGADHGVAVQLRHPQLSPAHRFSLRLRRQVPAVPARHQRHRLQHHRRHILQPFGGALLCAGRERGVRPVALVGCERYGVMPLARMVQQSQYHPSLPAEERGSLTVQPPDKGRNFPRTGRKQLQQQLRVKLGRRQAWRLKTAQQLQGPGTPASARNKADLTTRHPAVQWGLEPRPTTAVTVSGQDLVGAEQRAGISAHPWYGSIGPSPITAQCGATPVPAVKERRQQGPGRGCRCNKHLGKCEHQIAPHEVRYQLHNVDSRTLLHCNCTRRLARCLRKVRECSDMDVAVLADHITMDCFVLELLAACSPGRGSQHSCTTVTRAVLVPARQLKKTLRGWGPLPVSSKAKHPHWKTQAKGGTFCEQCQHLVIEHTPGTWPHTVPR